MAPGERSNEYEFFENMDKNSMYKAVISVNNETALEVSAGNTAIIDCNSRVFNDAQKNTCTKFNKLINSLCSIKSSSGINSVLNDSDYNYLKLWTVLALESEGATNNASLEEISTNINYEIDGCFNKDPLKSILVDIDGDQLKKMKLLDKLYKNYFEMHYIFDSSSEEIRKCLEYSKECINDYKTARRYCKNSNDNFYKALMKFEQIYINRFMIKLLKGIAPMENI
ncbi:hypothetical protein PVC01_000007000 [Plasmodium vivax]|uniref:VIR protein n=1 Tax=Plasmodium vivax TaxID=5855 RepID=A0A1G4E9Q8_PLAVI|nr:hypothetical protein PVC01_000007000 [Plasmodium vivax]